MNLEKVRVFNEGLTIGENLPNDYFVPMNPEKFHPAQRGIPMTSSTSELTGEFQSTESQILDTVIIFQYLVLLKRFHDEVMLCLVYTIVHTVQNST